VVQLRHHDFVAGSEATPQGPRHVEGERRHVRTEHDLVRRATHEIGDRRPAFLQDLVQLARGRVRPVRVGVVAQHLLGDRPGYALGHLGTPRSIEVRSLNIALESPQGREPLADGDQGGDVGSRCDV
jgi:hypothetical protein